MIRALIVLLLAACAEPAPREPIAPIPNSLFEAEAARQWRLPLEILEISGLAVSPDGRLFAHDDERAVIYEIDAQDGHFVNRFAVGAPLTGDFEGLAIEPSGMFWMITSDGRLLRFEEGGRNGRVEFESFDTGLAEICEIEGLAFLAAAESLIIACKRNHARGMRDSVLIYEWRPGGGPAQVWRTLSQDEIAEASGVRTFRPSSIEIDARSGRILLLSAFDAALLELDADGIAAARRLGRIHRQAEGVTVLPDGSLVISDEGRDTRALLSVYGRTP